jgi:outer membrane receptor for ferrienterochelin and colicins
LAVGIKLAEWWQINLSGNIYDYQVNGMFKNNSINQRSTNYNSNANTTIDIGKSLKFQWGFAYTSNTVTSQGHDTHLFLSTGGGRYTFWNKRGYIGLQVNNIFNTNAQTIITQGPDFFSSTEYIKYDRALQVSFGWQLNNNTKKTKAAKTDYGEKEF